MAYEQRENSGTLFPNEDKKASNHPDYRGELNVGGELFEIAAWTKNGRRGEFLSLSVKPKRAQSRPQSADNGGQRSGGGVPF